ncbi:MAG TPA: RbsD/FucU family protein [Candidatus Hydrogenedentes bacterium]|nr:RbsD/FucU family protein [Candidatus Hydrogenedentota bacterium]
MLKHRLLHPDILEAIASAGHGSRILIADGNYPASTCLGENAALVYLNLAPGKLTVTEVLETLLSAVEIEEAAVMTPGDGPEPPIFDEFRRLLPGLDLVEYDRFEFYEEASGPETCLQIVTGERRLYANLLLTLGVVNA